MANSDPDTREDSTTNIITDGIYTKGTQFTTFTISETISYAGSSTSNTGNAQPGQENRRGGKIMMFNTGQFNANSTTKGQRPSKMNMTGEGQFKTPPSFEERMMPDDRGFPVSEI